MMTLSAWKINRILKERNLTPQYLKKANIAPSIVDDIAAGNNVQTMDFEPVAKIGLLLKVTLADITQTLG